MKLLSAIKMQSNSLRQFALKNNIAYAVLHDVCTGKKSLWDCKVSTAKKIANGLNISLDELLSERPFPQFRDALHNSLRQYGDLPWLIRTLKEDSAAELYQNQEILHAIYLVDLIDYICGKHNLPLPKEYQHIRELKLRQPYYVGDWHLFSNDNQNDIPANAIHEFLRSNIIECEVYDAV